MLNDIELYNRDNIYTKPCIGMSLDDDGTILFVLEGGKFAPVTEDNIKRFTDYAS